MPSRMFIVLLGPPGSGKGTQAERLAAHFHVPHISTGELLRSSQDPDIKAVIDSGALVSDSQMIPLVKRRLKSEKGGWILDGFPRTIEQAHALSAMGPEIPKVLYLKTDEDEIKKRLLFRRSCKTYFGNAECHAKYNAGCFC